MVSGVRLNVGMSEKVGSASVPTDSGMDDNLNPAGAEARPTFDDLISVT
jgi:hypothetical protein